MNIIKIDSTSSTNIYLKELSQKQEVEELTVVQAYSQTAGRGQSGTSWEAEPGKNITCSILFYPSFLPLKKHFLLSEVIALGVKEVLEEFVQPVCVKWPNDVYINDKKITGILIENELIGQEILKSIVGIGVNINQEIFTSNAQNPVSLKQLTGIETDLDLFLKRMMKRISYWYDLLKKGSYSFISRSYNDTLYRKSGFYRYQDRNGQFMAEILEVKDSGLFFLRTDKGEERSYSFKEISFIY
ncbi:MAG: biotin--[acetyl-CoA-carboxylase] ligase [Bacteroidales bacterium]|nr:biotin--[acetyl-CoA-carboxylase] ligase [Bacteroidales bacterium]